MSLGLLVAGLAGGLSLGTDTPAPRIDSVQADADDIQLLKQRQNAQSAARAALRTAEDAAASRAAAEVRIDAARAKRLEARVVAAKKAAEARRKASRSVEIPGSCGEYSGSRATGCALMLQAGFGIDQFPCLDRLWDHESGWNHRATNSGSGAYGIPQAYPGSKMASAGADWRTNPATQIKWGLGYVKGRYGTPCGAWSRFQSAGSY